MELSDVEGATVQTEGAFIGFVNSDADIERICEECSEQANPPEVFLLSGDSIGNSLLVVSVDFLTDGRLLVHPGLTLVGAALNLEWGFARAEVESRADGSADFRLPSGRFESFTGGDIWGYRLCPIDNCDLAEVIRELGCIRATLARPRQQPKVGTGISVVVTGI